MGSRESGPSSRARGSLLASWGKTLETIPDTWLPKDHQGKMRRGGAGLSEGSKQPTLKKNFKRTWRLGNFRNNHSLKTRPLILCRFTGGLVVVLRGQGKSAVPLQTPPSQLLRTQGQSGEEERSMEDKAACSSKAGSRLTTPRASPLSLSVLKGSHCGCCSSH